MRKHCTRQHIQEAIEFWKSQLKKLDESSGIDRGIIPASIVKILEDITILDSVKSIGRGAFCNCTSLESIVFEGKTRNEVEYMAGWPFGLS